MATTKPKIDVERYFTAGTKVEVDMDPPLYRNSWYVATIITPPAPRPPDFQIPNHHPRKYYCNRLLYKTVTTVEYENLMEEDGVSKKRETIDAVQIRPIPPMERSCEVEFKVGDKVDALISGGWWEGEIVKVLVEGMIFEVYFRCIVKHLEFYGKDLRIHREWVHGGDWDPPLLDELDEKEKSEVTERTNA